ncbi:MAG: TIGR01777 family oxidoreductase [Jatrophihabitans sp.]|uniref:TIGR01777 family oxidoreductase n=1 Tax=Jatrophihabitans sp. TaxID=1932789 RepID=UPI003F81A022
MRVVVAGASGLIGTALVDSLRAHGHTVRSLVRRATSDPDSSTWDPARGEVDHEFLRASDAVVCLSGANVGAHRWTETYKQKILDSRVQTVGTLATALAALARAGQGGPRVFLAASAVGYYGDGGDARITEQSPQGSGFLADVCRQWEAAAEPARAAGVRVAHLRTGLVLSSQGDLLKRLKLVTKLGVAGRLGSGQQFMPWITLADEIGAIEFLLTADVAGPVNLTGPHPVRNAEFIKTLGSLLHRPTVLPTPAFALKLALGEFAQDTLTGQQAVPQVLLDAGYRFQHDELEPALRWALDH